jgi:hypothetical protein
MILDIERGSTRSLCKQNWHGKRIWRGYKTDCGMNKHSNFGVKFAALLHINLLAPEFGI